jgi:hypothetical protein
MPAAEPERTEARPVAAAVLEHADPLSVQASRAGWLCGLAEEVDPSRTEQGTSQ